MLKVSNLKDLNKRLNGLVDGFDKIMLSDGKNLVKEVREDLNTETSRISPASDGEVKRPAMFEAAYVAELKGDEVGKQRVEQDMTEEELTREEEELVDRYIRDFINNAFRNV